MKTIKYILSVCCILLFAYCKEEIQKPLTEGGDAPEPVKNIVVERLPGSVRLKYTLPDNSNLMYVKAEFETQGKMRDVKATYFTDTLLLEGFGDTLEHEVKIYSVSRNEVSSAPVVIKVRPKKPPVFQTFDSMTLDEDFGGARMTYKNTSEADLSLTIIHKDADGFWVVDDVLYTKSIDGSFSARGLESKLTTFGVYAKDRWGNYSDTLTKDLTPIFEREILKPFVKMPLTSLDPLLSLFNDKTDADAYNANTRLEKIWDGKIPITTVNDGLATKVNNGIPASFTFDLKVTSRLSRFIYHQRQEVANQPWGDSNPRLFEIWGRASLPTNPSWDGWTKLMDVESVKPSGLPLGQNSPEDLALILKGEEFNFSRDIPPIRYVRIKIIESWAKTRAVSIGELTFFGE